MIGAIETTMKQLKAVPESRGRGAVCLQVLALGQVFL